MVLPPTLPAIVGTGQVLRPPHDEFHTLVGPIELMVEAARSAAEDAGNAAVLDAVDWIGVAGGHWTYRDPGLLVGYALGRSAVRTVLSPISGTAPQELVGHAADLVARGEIAVALVVGGEARWTEQRLARTGGAPRWFAGPGAGTPELLPGFPAHAEVTEEFKVFGAIPPAYALMEDSLRAARGTTVDMHRSRIGALWSSFSDVASRNPYAWDRTRHTAADIREPSSDNRMIAFPYTKAMVANNTVDMASAILLCSAEAARRFGITPDRMVFPHAVTKAHDTWLVAGRDSLHRSPALRVAGQRALDVSGIAVDDIEHIDLYACFPVMVQMAVDALGISHDRELTVTGGLGFAGAAIGNAAGHSIASLVPLVRAGGWGLVHANGGIGTKHAFGVYAAHPPTHFVLEDSQPMTQLHERPSLDRRWSDRAVVEAATVVFSHEGPSHVVAALRPHAEDGLRRGWGTTTDATIIDEVMTNGLVSAEVHRSEDGTIS